MTQKNKEYNKNKTKVEISPGFTMILKDMESRIASEERDKVIQAQIYRLNTRIDQLDQKKADRRGRKKKKVKS